MEGDHDPAVILSDIRKTLKRLVWATCIVYLVIAGLLTLGWFVSDSQRQDLRDQSESTQKNLAVLYNANCTFREDLQNRVITGQQFLIDNPNGIPGFSAKTLQASIDGQLRTIATLSNLNCGK